MIITPFLITLFLWLLIALMLSVGGPLTIDVIVMAAIVAFLFGGLPFIFAGIKIIPQYERAAVLRLGKYIGLKGPGPIFIDVFLDKVFRFDLRVQTIDIPAQEVLTKDNINIKVDAVIIYRVLDPGKAFITVKNVPRLLFQYGQANLREVLGIHELDEILQKREEMAKIIQGEVDRAVGDWGIKVISVALQQIYLPENMVRALAMQAEAERERRAKIISAEGERQAAEIMSEAARFYVENPIALRLRELTTLVEVAKEKNTILLYPTTFGAMEQSILAAMALRKSKK
ncbi:MAG: SPFH domain-containing protein [Candidatus Njordarchaeota archaeon]